MEPELLDSPDVRELTQIVATMLTAAITSTARPFLTLFMLFAVPTMLIETGVWAASDWVFGDIHRGVLGGLGILAVIEHFWRGTELYADLVEQLPWDRLPVLVAVWLMFMGGFANAAAPPEPSDRPGVGLGMGMGSILLGVSLTLHWGVAWARRRMLELLRDLGMMQLYNWLEPLGVIGLLLMVLALPIVALGLALTASGVLAFVAAAIKVIERRIDRGRRRDCPSCGHSARAEASRCPSCGASLQVTRNLSIATA